MGAAQRKILFQLKWPKKYFRFKLSKRRFPVKVWKNDLASESGEEECSDSESLGRNNIRNAAKVNMLVLFSERVYWC